MSTRQIPMIALAIFSFSGVIACADEPKPSQPITLMGMLSEWLYPECGFEGAQSSDAAVKDISSIKNKAVLTTSDPADKVFVHYLAKLNVDPEGKNLDEKAGERITTKRAISVQDLSAGRPLKLYVIAITEPKNATTLVISQADGEPKTRIAWSNFRQLWPE